MKIATLYVRFYRSFNFDLVRKARPNVERLSWEEIDGAWFPFIRVRIDPVVTAVVGANESGKSHLLGAIKAALTGEGFDERDFCRYSTLFSAEVGKRRVPDFGLDLELDADDLQALSDAGLGERTLTFLRLNGGVNQIVGADGEPKTLSDDQLEALQVRLPRPFELKTGVAIPKSISFEALTARDTTPLSDRRKRVAVLETLRGFDDAEAIRTAADELAGLLLPQGEDEAEIERRQTSDALARTLLVDIARIAPDSFSDLELAVKAEEEGNASALIDSMNRSVATHLNVSRRWTQDEDFELRVDVREHEVVFLVRDKTGISYSFDERSTGLRYFLGYYVQLRAHEAEKGRPEVLLMDEPDAFLSNVGQQDLLGLFESFARPEFPEREDQVVYVTHSPFLVNKNAAHRLRVLDKGSDEEGTRVIRDASRNHYEPIRSSVGGFVAETAFVGGANLFVEGLADQVLLAAATALLRDRGTAPGLLPDLNAVTIVPCGSASHIPYMAYLARGRDEVKPPCVALLDGDDEGRKAITRLRRDVDGRPIIDPAYVIDLGEWAANAPLKPTTGVEIREIEDLIPRSLMLAAARLYAQRFMGLDRSASTKLTNGAIGSAVADADKRSWKGLKQAFADAFDGVEIDKVGFARELADLLERSRREATSPQGIEAFAHNFGALLRELAKRLAEARRTEVARRRNRQLKQLAQSFERDHPLGARRDQADEVLRSIERSLEDSPQDDIIRQRTAEMRRYFGLKPEDTDLLAEHERFLDELRALPQQPRVAQEQGS